MEIQRNNFGLIKIIAAIQVTYAHVFGAFGFHNIVLEIVELFPGVPIFFFISGILISNSFKSISEKSKEIIFYKNRIHRIFPALYMATFIGIVLSILSGYIQKNIISIYDFLIFLISQFTIFQFYTPNFLREYGVGSFNGITWSLFVEIQMYILYPWLSKIKKKYLLIILLISLMVNHVSLLFDGELIFIKILNITLLPWLYMFIFGLIINERIIDFCKKTKFIYLMGIYLLTYYISGYIYHFGGGNKINIFCFISLMLLVLKIAYLDSKIIIRRDISFGIYLYHMLVLNYFIYIDFFNKYLSLFLVLAITYIFSNLSYLFIEKRYLNRRLI